MDSIYLNMEEQIAKTEEENKRLEEAIKKREELLIKQEQLLARQKLGGTAEAGLPIKTEKEMQAEKDQEDADKIFSYVYDKKKK